MRCMGMERPIDNDDLPELPDELVEALKEDPTPLITSRVDRAIEAQARRAFKSRKAARPVRKHRITRWAAIAASVVAAVIVIGDMRQTRTLYADHDDSGQIDIADVLALAREGYDEAQLDAFAMQIVSLDEDAT